MTQLLQRANQKVNKLIGQADIILEVEGRPYQNFKSVRVEASIENLTRFFEASVTFDAFNTFPIKVNNAVSVLIEGTYVFTGYVENLEANDTNDGTEIRISGRDKLADVLDSSLISPVSFPSPAKLSDIILKVLVGNGNEAKIIPSGQAKRGKIGGFIGIIDEILPEDYNQEDLIEAEVGQNVFEFLNAYASRRQVLLSSDGYGNLIITRGAASGAFTTPLVRRHVTTPANALNAVAGSVLPTKTRENNVLSASLQVNNESRFNFYRFTTQKNGGVLSSLGGNIDVKSMVDTNGEATDSEMRAGRALVVSMDSSRSASVAQDRAIWEANIRRIRSKRYSCNVQGFKSENDNDLWDVNRLVEINDEKNNMNGQLLISSLTYDYSDGGSVTSLSLTDPDAYKIQANITSSELRTNKSFLGIIGS